ncbi:hypothetical protein FACS1894180_0910 [Bacteroidia bacterium]|nr:hypothetical protein FACS1894180_0910 [Bacteroidia bacterium]
MNKNILTIAVLLFSAGLAAQPTIKRELNLPRANDVLVKQQVAYKDPGRAGADVVWDFGQLAPVNPEYTFEYGAPFLLEDSVLGGYYLLGRDTVFAAQLQPADALLTGMEHRTMYYYAFASGVLWTLGYDNAATSLHYRTPLLTGKLPMTYGDSLAWHYATEGLYTRTVPFAESGLATLAADAYGMIVLPTGDTLRQVLRTKSVQQKDEPMLTTTGDSATVRTFFETFKWYARGYRYPVFETRRTIVYAIVDTDSVAISSPSRGTEGADSTGGALEIDRFETAFLYPPPQDYSENPDTANINELARMAVETGHAPSLQGGEADYWADLNYNIFPNPVMADLQFELYLPHPVQNLRVQIRNKMGMVFIDEQKGAYPQGINAFTFNMSGLMHDNYVLDFWLDGYLVHGSVLMKR